MPNDRRPPVLLLILIGVLALFAIVPFLGKPLPERLGALAIDAAALFCLYRGLALPSYAVAVLYAATAADNLITLGQAGELTTGAWLYNAVYFATAIYVFTPPMRRFLSREAGRP